MKQRISGTLLLATLALALASCGSPSSAQQPLATPTPLPPDPALEKQTYTVKRGPIERALEITGKVTPIDQVSLAFLRDGTIEAINVQQGDTVKQGDVVATLLQNEELDELRAAEDKLVQAQRALDNARKSQARAIREAERTLQRAQEALNELLPGGENDVIRAAQDEVQAAERALRDTRDDQANGKIDSEIAVREAAESLITAQKAWSKAYWDNDWVERYGTDPDEPTIPDPDDPTRRIPNRLDELEREEFAEALRKAANALEDAERGVERAKQSYTRTREGEVLKIAEAEKDLEKKRSALAKLIEGRGDNDLTKAQEAVESAREALEEAQQSDDIEAALKAVEEAQRDLDKKRKQVTDGQLIAPRDGQVLSVAYANGDPIEAFEPILDIADPTRLEFSAQLGGEQVRQLAEGQPAEIRLLTRPDVALPAVIRRLPGGQASGGSLQDRDQTTRFEILDFKGLQLRPTEVGRIRIVLEEKPSVLLLPPEAIRTFEGRRFVVIRTGDRERRVAVRVGITTETAVEILEGVAEGDVVVGP